jgi:hypothetical protein
MSFPRSRISLLVHSFLLGVGAIALGGSLPRPPSLAGTWILTAAPEVRPDGTTGQTFGPDPRGLLIIDEAGRYSLQIFRPDRPKFASGDKRRGTVAEYEAAALGMSSHIGRCHIDEATGTLVFEIEFGSFPNWDGTVQRREYRLEGDELTYRVPALASGNGTIAISSWRRVSTP